MFSASMRVQGFSADNRNLKRKIPYDADARVIYQLRERR